MRTCRCRSKVKTLPLEGGHHVLSAVFCPDGSMLATVGNDAVRLWRLEGLLPDRSNGTVDCPSP